MLGREVQRKVFGIDERGGSVPPNTSDRMRVLSTIAGMDCAERRKNSKRPHIPPP